MAFILPAHICGVIAIPGFGRKLRRYADKLILILEIVLHHLFQTSSITAVVIFDHRKNVQYPVHLPWYYGIWQEHPNGSAVSLVWGRDTVTYEYTIISTPLRMMNEKKKNH